MVVPRRATLAAFVFVSLALGCFFRLYRLGEKVVWHDEVATRVFAAGYLQEDWRRELLTGEVFDVAELQKYQHKTGERSALAPIVGLARDDPHHPPLYYVFATAWVAALGDGVATLRSLSVIFSLLAALAMGWLSAEIGGSARSVACTIGLASVSPFFVLYGQDAREYALWAFFCASSFAALVRAMRVASEPASGRARVARLFSLYAALVVLGLYTSFSMAWVIAAQIVYVAARERLRWRRAGRSAVLALGASALAVAPWAFNLARHWEVFQTSMRWSKEIVIPRSSLLRLLGYNATTTFADVWAWEHSLLATVVVLLSSCIVVVALARVARGESREAKLSLLPLVLLPIGMLLVPDLVFGGIRSISTKYLTPCWIGVVVALGHLGGEPPRRASGLAAALPPWLFVAAFGAACLTSAIDAPKRSLWTKGLSMRLVAVADHINASERPLVVGNLEQYNPGNMMALSLLLAPGTKVQILDASKEEHYALPRGYGAVYLLNPIGVYREGLERREGVHCTLLEKDVFVELYRVDPGP